jgi:hypothetical protein
MALGLRPGTSDEYAHRCPLPWPVDPEMPEGHVCECGRRWVYQPARWDPLLTLEELRLRHEAGEFSRGIIPPATPEPPPAMVGPGEEDRDGVIVRIPPARGERPAPAV